MQAENLSVAAAFDLSYQDLPPARSSCSAAWACTRATDIDAYAAAALGDTDLAAARRHLEALYDQYLIAEPARGRYRLHDLIREHARALAATDEPAVQEAATSRVLDYYQQTGDRAGALIARQTRPAPAAADGAVRLRFPAWPTVIRRWPGPGPSVPACSPAWTMPPDGPACPGHRAYRRPGRAHAARWPLGRRHHPAHSRGPGRVVCR